MIRIGIICPSEIAIRRFLPALQQSKSFRFVGVAYANEEEYAGASEAVIKAECAKAENIVSQYGGQVFSSYRSLIEFDGVDAIYLPLPPGLHFQWAKCALEAGKHVFVEKPCTTRFDDTDTLISIAQERKLVVYENYMFIYHNQINEINDIVNSGEIGNVRLYRINFGFPMREQSDFRYNKALGGGALLDCGGYTLKYASALLGSTAHLVYAMMNSIDGFAVDMYGSAVLINDEGLTVQLSFGMDNDYKCELEVWGSRGTLRTGRVFTAPAGFSPSLIISKNGKVEERELSKDDAFLKSIDRFAFAVRDDTVRNDNYTILLRQARLVDDFICYASR